MIVEVRLKGALTVGRALANVLKTIQRGGSNIVGRRLAREGLRIVERLTPRQTNANRASSSKRGHEPFHTQWEIIEEVARQTAYRAIIRNKATMTTQGTIALASVEFGAKRHRIPKGGFKTMMWADSQRIFVGRISDLTRPQPQRGSNVIIDRFSERDGGEVFAKSVNHPGNQAFRMVQETRLMLQDVANRLLTQFASQIASEFRGFQMEVR